MECSFCDNPAIGEPYSNGYSYWPVCGKRECKKLLAEQKKSEREKSFKFDGFVNISAERQARMDFANKYYCGY